MPIKIIEKMNNIKHKIIVMSGKGGVGKTTVAVNLAYSLSEKGFKVGLLDIDIHGPNTPKMLGLENKKFLTRGGKIIPIKAKKNLNVTSMAFLLEKEDAVIWRGPLKHKVIKQFTEDVDWGKLDYLIVDSPPGTGDEIISISQLLNDIRGSIIVSTPQQVALLDADKSIDFSKKMDIPIIGLIENMAGDMFGEGSVSHLADDKYLNFLGSLKLDKNIIKSGDGGNPFVIDKSLDISKSFENIVKKIMLFCENRISK